MQQIKIEIYIINLDDKNFHHIKSFDLSNLSVELIGLKLNNPSNLVANSKVSPFNPILI